MQNLQVSQCVDDTSSLSRFGQIFCQLLLCLVCAYIISAMNIKLRKIIYMMSFAYLICFDRAVLTYDYLKKIYS